MPFPQSKVKSLSCWTVVEKLIKDSVSNDAREKNAVNPQMFGFFYLINYFKELKDYLEVLNFQIFRLFFHQIILIWW